MRLGLRLGVVYALLSVLLIVAVFSAARTLTLIAADARALAVEDAGMQMRLARLRTAFDQAVQGLRLAAAEGLGDEEARARLDAASRVLSEVERHALPQESAATASLRTLWNRTARALWNMRAAPSRDRRVFEAEVLPALTTIGDNLHRLENIRKTISTSRIDRIQTAVRAAWVRLALFVLLIVMVGAELVFLIRRRILNPLNRLTQATEMVAQGRLSHRVAVSSKDEMGDLARRFNDMAARLSTSEKAKMEFLSMISHDMKTPLTLINIYAYRLTDPRVQTEGEKVQKALDIIINETRQLQYLIEDLMDTARAETGLLRIDPCPTETSSLMTSMILPFERQAEKKGIEFSYDIPDLPSAIMDGKRIGRALRNLIINALKFTPKGGRVEVRARRADPDLCVEVIDTGSGIPEADIPHIFQRFYQAASQKNAGHGGMGLGLAIVREIARAHGGDVDVESEVGKGTVFRLKIPFLAVQPQEEITPQPSTP